MRFVCSTQARAQWCRFNSQPSASTIHKKPRYILTMKSQSDLYQNGTDTRNFHFMFQIPPPVAREGFMCRTGNIGCDYTEAPCINLGVCPRQNAHGRLTHWRVKTHLWVIICSGNGLSPGYYSNQWWRIVNRSPRNERQWKIIQNTERYGIRVLIT